jgi:hypothetical protein
MEIQVLIDPIANNRYRACGGPPFPFIAEGDTPQDAVQNLRQLIQDRLKSGSELIQVNVPVEEDNPWLKMAGMWDKNDPLVQEWKEIIRENRLKDE